MSFEGVIFESQSYRKKLDVMKDNRASANTTCNRKVSMRNYQLLETIIIMIKLDEE